MDTDKLMEHVAPVLDVQSDANRLARELGANRVRPIQIKFVEQGTIRTRWGEIPFRYVMVSTDIRKEHPRFLFENPETMKFNQLYHLVVDAVKAAVEAVVDGWTVGMQDVFFKVNGEYEIQIDLVPNKSPDE